LRVEVEIVRNYGGAMLLRGRALVDGELRAEGRITLKPPRWAFTDSAAPGPRAAAPLSRRAMDWKRLRATLRFDGAAWRRFAELGCVYGPEGGKRGSPPVIAAIIFAIARAQRAAVLANQRQIHGPIPGPRGWLRERWHAYRVFAEFA